MEHYNDTEIADKLRGYVKVDDIADVPLNTHIRYFIKQKDGSWAFRTGGFLHDKQNPQVYVILNNGNNQWSVQVKDIVFFKKMSQTEEIEALRIMYESELGKKNRMIDTLRGENYTLMKQISKL